MKSDKSLESTPARSLQTKQAISLASEQLTKSEIDALRLKKKQISASYQKVIEAHLRSRMA